jgi:outer membrane lipoprotein-sorting protein
MTVRPGRNARWGDDIRKKPFRFPPSLGFVSDLLRSNASSLRRMVAPRMALVLMAGALLAACSVAGTSAVSSTSEVASPDTSKIQESTQTLVERGRRIDAMQAEGVMGYDGGGQRLKIREEIAIKRPSSMRVEAMTPFGVGAVVVADGPRLAIYEPSQNTFYRGASTADSLSRFARIPMPPAEAIKLLMGLLPGDAADFSTPGSVRTEGDLVIGTYQLPDGAVDELGFTGGQLRMVRAGGKSGRPAYEVHYDDYRDVGGLLFAHKLQATFLNTGTHLNVTYSGVVVNPTLDDSEFVLVPPDKAKVIDLDVPALMGGNG